MPVQYQNRYEDNQRKIQSIRNNTSIHLQVDHSIEALENQPLLYMISQFTANLKLSKKDLTIYGICKAWLNPRQRSNGSGRKSVPK